jgi:small subunit ribosomal protein S20
LPATGSAAKRQRQNEKRRLRNKMTRSKIKTFSKKFEETVNRDSKEEAEAQYRQLTSMLDRAVIKGVYHRNTAARKKSKLHRLLSKVG